MNPEIWYGWNGLNSEWLRSLYFIQLPPEAMSVLMPLHLYFKTSSFPFWLMAIALIAACHGAVMVGMNKSTQGRQLRQKILFFVSFIASYLVMALLINFLKESFSFPRPYVVFADVTARVPMELESAKRSFPSGHAAFAGFLLVSCWGSLNWFLRSYGVFIVLAVCTSRMLLGVHFPADVVYGSILGMLITWIVFGIVHSLWYRTLEK